MTRLNCVPVATLSDQHLVAEYRELPRIIGAATLFFVNHGKDADPLADAPKSIPPEQYRLGVTHMKFFYKKLLWLQTRFSQLVKEMKYRGFHVTFHSLPEVNLPANFWNEWTPTEEDIALCQSRLKVRTDESALRKQEKARIKGFYK